MIAIFGPKGWTTPLTTVLIVSSQFALATWVLARRFGSARAMLFMAASLLAFSVVASKHGYFSQYLGEAPLVGFLLLGCAMLARDDMDTRRVALAGLCFGLALLTKQIAVFCTLGALSVWSLRQLLLSRADAAKPIALVALWAAAPVIAYEFIKLVALGWSGYMANIAGLLEYVGNYHPSQPDRLAAFTAMLRNDYAIVPGTLMFIGLALGVTVAAATSSRWRTAPPTFAMMLFAAAALHLLYVLVLSRTWERLFWPGLMALMLAAVSPVLFAPRRTAIAGAVAFALLAVPPAAVLDGYRLQLQNTDGSVVEEQRRVVRIISSQPELAVTSIGWPSLFDTIYRWPAQGSWHVTKGGVFNAASVNALVPRNKTVPPFQKQWPNVERLCTDLMPDGKFYTVYRCPRDNLAEAGAAPAPK